MNMQGQKGFTLVEIAIVLVIIGLLLGGVLKGQEMIKGAEIKNFINDMNGLSAAMHTYRDRYQAIPGDDRTATTHLRGVRGIRNGNGDGRISNNTERQQFYAQLRGSGLIKGTGTAPATHALGGSIQAQNNGHNLRGTVFCANNVSGANALIIDSKTDDGAPNTGSVQGNRRQRSYNPTGTYTVCFQS